MMARGRAPIVIRDNCAKCRIISSRRRFVRIKSTVSARTRGRNMPSPSDCVCTHRLQQSPKLKFQMRNAYLNLNEQVSNKRISESKANERWNRTETRTFVDLSLFQVDIPTPHTYCLSLALHIVSIFMCINIFELSIRWFLVYLFLFSLLFQLVSLSISADN